MAAASLATDSLAAVSTASFSASFAESLVPTPTLVDPVVVLLANFFIFGLLRRLPVRLKTGRLIAALFMAPVDSDLDFASSVSDAFCFFSFGGTPAPSPAIILLGSNPASLPAIRLPTADPERDFGVGFCSEVFAGSASSASLPSSLSSKRPPPPDSTTFFSSFCGAGGFAATGFAGSASSASLPSSLSSKRPPPSDVAFGCASVAAPLASLLFGSPLQSLSLPSDSAEPKRRRPTSFIAAVAIAVARPACGSFFAGLIVLDCFGSAIPSPLSLSLSLSNRLPAFFPTGFSGGF